MIYVMSTRSADLPSDTVTHVAASPPPHAYSGGFRWFMRIAGIGLCALWLYGLGGEAKQFLDDHLVLRTVLDCSYDACQPGEDGEMTYIADGAWFRVPAFHAKPKDVWKVAYVTCASQSVKSLAPLFVAGVRSIDAQGRVSPQPRPPTTADAVARRYADHSGGRWVYTGCLQGFRTHIAEEGWRNRLGALLALTGIFAGFTIGMRRRSTALADGLHLGERP
jgi:hypothetical protein